MNVLIICHDFPPLNSIGAQRPYSWYKYLKKHNIYPYIITMNWDGFSDFGLESNDTGKIIKCNSSNSLRDVIIQKYGNNKLIYFRKVLTGLHKLLEHHLIAADTKKNIYKKADHLLSSEKIDAIIATGEPFILFKYAYKLSQKYSIPWYADYRDGWTTNYSINYSSILNKIINRYLFKPLEIKYIKSARKIFTVSKPLAKDLARLHNKKPIVITNGYFPALINQSNEKQRQDVFEILYAGNIYPYQRLDVFIQGFLRFMEGSEKNILLSFYGLTYENTAIKTINSLQIKFNDRIKVLPKTSYSNMIGKLKKANLLLLLAGNKFDGSAAKVFDYLAVKRQILLAINDNGTLNDLITETNSGYICNDEYEVYSALKLCYNEWEKTKSVQCNTKNIDKYSREFQTKILAENII